MNAGPRNGQIRADAACPALERRAGARATAASPGKDVLDAHVVAVRRPSAGRGLDGRLHRAVQRSPAGSHPHLLRELGSQGMLLAVDLDEDAGRRTAARRATRRSHAGADPAFGEDSGASSGRSRRRARRSPGLRARSSSSGDRVVAAMASSGVGIGSPWGSRRGRRAWRRSAARGPPRCSAREPRPRRGRDPTACRAPRRGKPRSAGGGGSPPARPARPPR